MQCTLLYTYTIQWRFGSITQHRLLIYTRFAIIISHYVFVTRARDLCVSLSRPSKQNISDHRARSCLLLMRVYVYKFRVIIAIPADNTLGVGGGGVDSEGMKETAVNWLKF